MSKFIIIALLGQEISVSKREFKEAYQSGEHQYYSDKDPFSEYKVHFLIHKGNERAIAAYKALHNFDANEWGKNDRLNRCIDENGNVCKRDCRKCGKERVSHAPVSLDEREESGIQHPADSDILSEIVTDEFISEMKLVLDRLEEAERKVTKAIFGLDKPAVSLAEYAESEGLKYSTARSHRDRAMRKLLKLAAHLKDYLG